MANGSWVWMHKEDGAGFEEMGSKNRETGEWEADVDNDEKSGYTNAFRRAAQDAWGIARCLYRKGIPAWLDPNAKPLATASAAFCGMPAPAQSQPAPQAPRADYDDRPAQNPTPAPAPSAYGSPAPSGNGSKSYNNFKIPKPGKAVYAWAKTMEEHFKISLINGMRSTAEKQGWDTKFNDWNQEQINYVAGDAIAYLKGLDQYAGEFNDQGDQPAQAAPTPASNPPAAANTTDLRELKKDLINAVRAFLSKQLSRDGSDAEVKAAIGNIAAECVNGAGHAGEILDTLKDCTDAVWIRNMLAFTYNQIRQAVAGEGGGR
jgi:hypothetical protein